MDKDKLVELAERCEAAEGSDRELDVEIALDCAPIAQRLRNLMAGSPHNTIAEIAREADRESPHTHIPRYTASLDTAMTLVPGSARVGMSFGPDKNSAFVIPPGHDLNGPTRLGTNANCATPALALCAAALRSHAQPK